MPPGSGRGTIVARRELVKPELSPLLLGGGTRLFAGERAEPVPAGSVAGTVTLRVA
jgi:hypothetical protein